MGTGKQIELDYVIHHCQSAADAHKVLAMQASREKNDRQRDDNLAKAKIADEIAEHFRSQTDGQTKANPEVETLAREIDPEAFDSYEALRAAIIAEGKDDGYALQVARATYGDRIDDAIEQASTSIQTEANNPDYSGYDQGVEDVLRWHEQRALEADRLEQAEKVPSKKVKYAQRAKRHRLYARHIKQDIADMREAAAIEKAKKQAAIEPELPLIPKRTTIQSPLAKNGPEGGISLAVQAAFLRKSEVFDDEGWT